MLVELLFVELVYFNMCGKKFWNCGAQISRNCIELRHFYSYSRSPLKIQGKLFWKSASPNSRKAWRKLWFALSKFNHKIWRWLGTLGHFYFIWFVIFINVMVFVNNIYHIMPLLCNHHNLTLTFHQKKWIEVWLFIGRFKAERLPGMINKKALTQFIHKRI